MTTKQIAWNTGNGNITLTYQGQGDGTITVASDPNDLATARSQTIIIKTTKGGLKTKNLTITQGACPVPVGTVLNYSYTGSYQEVTLPAGRYKLQCWGAQGGSNAAASSYGITAQAGGKGGYSEGVLTLSQNTIVRIYVGGKGSASAGGFNGGGSTSGTSSYNSNNILGYSKMGGGGGATDIRLSDGALLSRMIVAGGGSGGAMCYKAVTTQETTYPVTGTYVVSEGTGFKHNGHFYKSSSALLLKGGTYKLVCSNAKPDWIFLNGSGNTEYAYTDDIEFTPGGNCYVYVAWNDDYHGTTIQVKTKTVTPIVSTSTRGSTGYAGGGVNGIGGDTTNYPGKQNKAGTNGSFGNGGNQESTIYRYCSGAGGGGWYGGGRDRSNTDMVGVACSGGGSGFVNTAANAGNRPSGYTGLQLDSGETKAGNTSFPNTAGTGNETGHSGNGYAKITRIE